MSQLLSNTKKKLAATVRTIEALQELDFPYPDSKQALGVIKDVFSSLSIDLDKASTITSEATITLCRRALEEIVRYLPILGFIARSTLLDGPVELQGPFRRLTHAAVGKDAKLIISSEWEFSPFTILYPELYKRQFVLVGMPFSESNNALIAPLAGHELGHNIWARENFVDLFQQPATDAVIEKIKSDWSNWSSTVGLEDPNQLTELSGYEFWQQAWMWGLAQAEETFCDFIGLLIFKESYLYAFEYLLSPGLAGQRNYFYPSLANRIAALVLAATRAGIPIPKDYDKGFQASEHASDAEQEKLGILSDTVHSALIDKLFDAADSFVGDHKLSFGSTQDTEDVYKIFQNVVPATMAKGLATIVNAAWRVSRDEQNFLECTYPSVDPKLKDEVLNDLVLKSFEVFEIEQLQAAL